MTRFNYVGISYTSGAFTLLANRPTIGCRSWITRRTFIRSNVRRRFDRRYCFIAGLIETITIAGSEILAGKQKNSGRGQRELKASVKSARGRTVSQVKWLQSNLMILM